MDNDFKIRLGAIIDNSSLTDIQKQLAKQKLTVSMSLDINNFVEQKKEANRIIKDIADYMVENLNIDDKISASWAKSYYSQVQSEAKKATAETEKLNKVQQQISNNEIKTKYDKVISDANKLTTASGNAAVSTEKLTTAYNELNQASQAYANDKSSATAQDNLRAKFESFSNVLKTTQSDISSYKVNATSSAESIVKAFDSKQITAQVDTASSKLKSFSNVTSDTKYSVETLTQNYKNLVTAITNYNKCSSDDEKAVSAQKVVSAYETLTTSINTANASAKSLNATFASDKEINNFYNKVQRFYNTNTACHKQFGNELQGIMTQLSSGTQLTTEDLAKLQAEFTKIGVQAQQAGLLGVSAFDKLKNVMSKLSYYTSFTYIFMKVVRGIKSMLSSINDLDTALIDLKKTTTMTDSQLEDFYYTANDVAKQMGVTTEEIISQAAAWSRLGYSSEEAATQMAQYSSLFASISPDMDTDTATEGLVSIMKAFDIGNDDTEEVLDGIISKINIIGNTQAVSNTDIVDFLENCSSAMSEANNTLDETIALGTAATEITQDASAVGNALKTVSMRIRSYDEETESYSEDLENISGEIADLTKTASTPGGISLFTDEDKTQYKSTYQILSEISEIYDEMTDKNQAELLEKLAGKRQGQVIAAILNNFSTAESSIDSMADSAGNAEAEMSIIMDSLDYKLNALSETGVGIAQNLFQTDDMKAIVDGATSVLGVVDSLTESLGLFGTIGVSAFATGVGLFIKNIAKYQTVGETLEASQVIQSTSTDGLAVSLKGYSASAVEAAIAQSTLDNETIKAILLAQGYNEATAEATATTLASATATNAQTEAMNAANKSTAGFSTTLKGFVSSNSTLLIITSIIAACYGAYKAFDYFNVSLDEAKENLEDSVTAYEETTSELESLESELSDINSQIAEINAQDSISLTDEQELENLKAQSAELEYQIALYKEKASLEAEDVLDDAKEQAKKKVSAISTGDGKDGSRITQTEQLQRAMDYYYQSDAKKRNLEQAVTALESKDSLTADEELYLKDYKYKIDQLESQESNAESEALEMAENLEAVASAMQEVKDNGGTLSDEDLALLEEYNTLLDEYSTFTENKNNNINPDYNSIKDGLVEEFDSNSLELSFDFNEDDVKETTEEAISKAQSVADDNSVEVDIVENLNNMDSYLTDGLDQLADIYSDVYDGDDFDWTSILNNDDFKDAFSGLGDSYENFIATIANSPSDISACQDAFNSLADAYLRNSGVLDDLTAETKDATIAFLEQKGIVNANEIVTNTLAGKEALLAATGKDLETATLSDVMALQKEGTASQDTINTLINLVGQKQLVNGTILDTSSDIKNLIALGNAIGSTTKALSILNSVKSGAVGMGGMSSSDYQKLVDNATAEVNSILSNYTSYSTASYKYTGSSGSSSSGSSSSSSSSSSTTALDKFETYCEKFFDWVEVRLDRLADKTEKWTTAAENAVTYSSQKSYYKKAISATTKEISANESAEKKYLKQENKVGQKAVSLGLVSQKWVNSITKKIANGTLDISKYSEKQQTVIEEMQTWYDKAQDASDAVDDLVYSLSDLYEELMNIANTKAEDKVSALSDKLDILSLKTDNATTYTAKNKLINQQSANAKSQMNAYTSAYSTTKSQLKSAKSAINSTSDSALKGLSSKDKKAIINAVKEGNSISIKDSWTTKAKKAIAKYNEALEANSTAATNAAKATEEYTQTLRENALTKLENISTAYSNKQSTYSQKQTQVENAMSLAEAQGYKTSTKYYSRLKSLEQTNLSSLNTEYNKLVSSLASSVASGAIETYSEAWYEAVSEIDEVSNAIAESTLAIQEYANEIRQINWDNFDSLQSSVSDAISEIDFMINELSREDLADDDTGWLTANGEAAIALHNANYQTYLKQAQAYEDEISSINKSLASDPYNEDLLERKRELLEAYQDAVSGAQDEKYAIIELYEQGYEALQNKLSDLISTYEELLDAEQDAYEYQQKIADATSTISTIKKQIEAYAGDTSEETRAKLQSLSVSLEEAESDLEETQYEQLISATKDMLSDMEEDLEDAIQDIIDSLSDNFDTLVSSLSDDTDEIVTTIKELMATIGYTSGTGDSVDWSGYLDGSTTYSTIAAQQAAAVASANSNASEDVSDSTTTSADATLKKAAETYIKNHVNKATKAKSKYSAVNQAIYSQYSKKVLSSSELKELAGVVGVTYDNAKKSGTLYTKLKSLGVSGFKRGSKYIPYDQLAMLGEEGAELHFDKSAGTLGIVGKGDKIYTNQMSDNLWKLAQYTPSELSNLQVSSGVPSMNNNTTEDVNINIGDIILPDVTNPKQFASALKDVVKNNSTVQNLLKDATIGTLSKNNNSLSIRKC